MGFNIKNTNIMIVIQKEIEENAGIYSQMRSAGIKEYAIRQAVYSNIPYSYLIKKLSKEILLSKDNSDGEFSRFSFYIREINSEFSKIDTNLSSIKYVFEENDFDKVVEQLKRKILKKYQKIIHKKLVSSICLATNSLLP